MLWKTISNFLLSFSLSMVVCVPLKYLGFDNLIDQDLATNLLFLCFGIFFVVFERLFNFRNEAKLRYNIHPINLIFLLFTMVIVWIIETIFIIPINHFFFPVNGFGFKPYFIISSIIIAPVFE
jgi:hypothetical protein